MADRMHFDEDDVIRSEEGSGSTFGSILENRMSRRQALQAGAFAIGAAALAGKVVAASSETTASPTGLDFTPIKGDAGANLRVAPGYSVEPVIRWGDAFRSKWPDFDAAKQTVARQKESFGYNADFVGFLPLPYGSSKSDHGLLAVNHEYVNPELMFSLKAVPDVTAEQAQICMEAVGFSVVEIRLKNGVWEHIYDSKYNKRYSATTEMEFAGPARGSSRLKSSTSPDGIACRGTMSNCAAGKTPWGTVLTAEENFQDIFSNSKAITDPTESRSCKRYGVAAEASQYGWDKHDDRFDCAKNPGEQNHFGWVVEIDPYDPTWKPRKRTSLGRMRHEAATTHVTKGGRVVMYSGDDARFEYVYKFVCARRFDPADRTKNREVLDDGILYVAKFNADGTGEWLPLRHGRGPLTEANGFRDQGDVVIDARIAADLLGATKMDRPEDIEVNPKNQKVYVVCTNNVDRGKEGKEGRTAMNPRNDNRHGHIIEITEENDDHAAFNFRWEMFLVCGDPADPDTYFAGFPKDQVSPISCPDNICFDNQGNLWIATDGADKYLKVNDGFFAVPTAGPERGKLKQFFSSVPGSEVCGPEFTPDGTTAFLAIQHPGEGSTYDNPSTSWPDGKGVPRPSVIAIRAEDGSVIGAQPAARVSRRDLFRRDRG